jgi:hypothetical protein
LPILDFQAPEYFNLPVTASIWIVLDSDERLAIAYNSSVTNIHINHQVGSFWLLAIAPLLLSVSFRWHLQEFVPCSFRYPALNRGCSVCGKLNELKETKTPPVFILSVLPCHGV